MLQTLTKKVAASQSILTDWLEQDSITRAWLICAVFLPSLMIILIPAIFIDDRTVDGVSVWAKPFKFAISLTLHALTIIWLSQQLTRQQRATAVYRWLSYAAIASILFESIYITIQASRGRASHFNNDTYLESIMYAFMGAGSLFIVTISFVLGTMIWRLGNRDQSAFRLGTILGLISGSLFTLIIAGYMSTGTSHFVGATESNAKTIPLLGWSTITGDLRVPHFFATHLMQLLPLLGLLFDRYILPSKRWMVIATILLTMLVTAMFIITLFERAVFPI